LGLVFALVIGILLVELIGALAANSLALLADAGHLAVDATGLGLALLAGWAGGRPADNERTFGYRRLEILTVLVNVGLLFGVGTFILIEAFHRLSTSVSVSPLPMIGVAALALVGNGVALLMLRPVAAHSLNVRAAYLEVLSDFAGAAAVIAAGLVILVSNFLWADLIASFLIGLLIVPRTLRLLREALGVLLEATPRGLNLAEVRAHILEAPGVVAVHDLHVWSISSGINLVSAHVIVSAQVTSTEVLDHLCRCLAGYFDVEHSTFQIERVDRSYLEPDQHD